MKKLVASSLLFFVLMATGVSFASAAVAPLDEIYHNLGPIANTYGQSSLLDSQNTQHALVVRVARVINVALSLLGIIFLVLTIYAGARWMTARGNDELVTTARDTLLNALIGLVIIFASYAFTTYLVTKILQGTIG